MVLRKNEYDALVDGMWDELRVMVPLETRYVVAQPCYGITLICILSKRSTSLYLPPDTHQG